MNSRPLSRLVRWGGLPCLLVSCGLRYPQRVPEPLFLPETEPRAPVEFGAARVTLQRDSDPVWVRLPGERGESGVPFYAKRQRVPAGTMVRTGAGGRLEVLWGTDATSLVLFDDGRATVGNPEAGEPVVRIHAVTHALLGLTPEDVVELPGGALLRGDPGQPTGPFFLEQVGPILRLTNQSKRVASLAFRSERGELGPGESIDLPRLALGTAPSAELPERLQASGLTVRFRGRLERAESVAGLSLRASEPTDVSALGVTVRLAPTQTACFSLLSLRSQDVPADASPVPTPPEGD